MLFMQKHKVIQIFRTFTSEELERFIQFIKLPYFNANPILLPLAIIIKKNISDTDDDWLKREKLYKLLFPKDLYQYSRLGEMFSRLYKLVVKYLGLNEVEKEPAIILIQAGMQCYVRRLPEIAEEILLEAIQIAEESKFKDAEYFYAKFFTSMLRNLLEQGNIHNVEKRVNIHEALDIWYLQMKLQLASEDYAQRKLVKGVPETPLLSSILEGLKGHVYLKVPLVGLYYYGFMMIVDNDNSNSHYTYFWDLFSNHSHELPVSYRIALLTKAKNYCLTHYYSGEHSYLKRAFLLDEYAESEGFLVPDAIISDTKFKSIVTLAFECGEIDWAKNFIERYAFKLSEETRENAKNLCMAELECNRRRFFVMTELLEMVKQTDDFDYLKIQILYMRMNFEIGFIEEVKRYCGYMKRLFKRTDAVSKEYEERVNLLVDFVIHITQALSPDYEKMRKELVEIEREAQKVTFNYKEWLLRQIEKLINKEVVVGVINEKINFVIPIAPADTTKTSLQNM